jgi:hypothetical protein
VPPRRRSKGLREDNVACFALRGDRWRACNWSSQEALMTRLQYVDLHLGVVTRDHHFLVLPLKAGGSAPQWRIAAGASPMASPTSPAVRVLQRLRVFTASWDGNLVQGWPWSDAPQPRRLVFFSG